MFLTSHYLLFMYLFFTVMQVFLQCTYVNGGATPLTHENVDMTLGE